MLKITTGGVYYKNGGFLPAREGPAAGLAAPEHRLLADEVERLFSAAAGTMN